MLVPLNYRRVDLTLDDPAMSDFREPTDRWEFPSGPLDVAFRVGPPRLGDVAELWGPAVSRTRFPMELPCRGGTFSFDGEQVKLWKAHFGITRWQRRVEIASASDRWHVIAAGLAIELRREADRSVVYKRRSLRSHDLVVSSVTPLECALIVVLTVTQALECATLLRFFQFI
jgi:hypothetical protein